MAENDYGSIEIAVKLFGEQSKKIADLQAEGLMTPEMHQEFLSFAPKRKEIEIKYAKELTKTRKALAKKISIAAMVIGVIALTVIYTAKKRN